MHTPNLSAGERMRRGGQGVEPPTKLSKKGLNRTSILERNCWETGGDFFRERGSNYNAHSG